MNPSLHHISQADIDALPTPIAVPANRYRQQKETDERGPAPDYLAIKLALMIDTIETVYKYGSAIVLQVMRKHPDWGVFKTSVLPGKSKAPIIEVLKQPQLGQHAGIIQSAFYHFKDRPQALPPILRFVTPLSEPRLSSSVVMRLRNRRKGHGAWPDEIVAGKALADFRKDFEKVLNIAKAISAEFPLYLKPSGVRFMGAQPAFPEGSLESEENWRLVIRGISNEWNLELYPLILCQRSGSIIYNGCNGCGDGKNSEDGTVTFLDYLSGGDLDLKVGNRVAEDFKSSFSNDKTAPFFEEHTFSQSQFTGRESDLRALDEFVRQDKNHVIIVSGERGIGKSTLLAKWREDFDLTGVSLASHVIKEGSENANPIEVARHLLHQINPSIRPAFDWSSSDFRAQLEQGLLNNPTKKWLILLDGIDECYTYLKKRASSQSLFDWIPSPSTTGLDVKWILGVRSPFASKNEFLSNLPGRVGHEVHPFDENDVANYLCRSLDEFRVRNSPELIPLVLKRTHGLPLELHLFVEAIKRSEAAYTRESILNALAKSTGLLQEGIGSLSKESQRLEEYLRKNDFAREERRLSRAKLPAADYQAECAALKARYHEDGELKFQNLMALLAIANEPLTEGLLIALLDFETGDLPYYLSLVSRYLREEQAGYSFAHDAYREYILREKTEWVGRIQQQLIEWCLAPANRNHGYTVRHGVTHLLAAYLDQPSEENAARVAELLTDIGFIATKIRAWLVPELLQDYKSALDSLPGGLRNGMLELEPLDPDQEWVVENRAARLAGLPVPHPGRGGESVLAAMNSRWDEAVRKSRGQTEKNRQDNIAAGRAPDDDGWDGDVYTGPFIEVETFLAGNEESEEPEQTEEQRIAEARLSLQQSKPERIAEERHKRERIAQIVRPPTATDRTIEKMKQCGNEPSKSDAKSGIAEFAKFVQEHWFSIAEERTDVPALCFNFRSLGVVHEAGEATLEQGGTWVEDLNPKSDVIERVKLRFETFDGSPDTGTARPFDNFRKCLAMGRIHEQPNSLWFEILDVTTNRVTTKMTAVYEGKLQDHRQLTDAGYLMVTEDGRFVRFWNLYFEVDSISNSVHQIDPDLAVKAALAGLPEHGDFGYYRNTNRFSSDDGSMAFLVNSDSNGIEFFDGKNYWGIHTGHLASWDYYYSGHKNSGFAVAAHGRIIAAVMSDRLWVYDLLEDICLLELKFDSSVLTMTFTQDGKMLALDCEGEILVWDVYGGSLLKRFAANTLGEPMHFSAAGELLFVGTEIVDLRTGPRFGQDFNLPKEKMIPPDSPKFLKLGEDVWDVLAWKPLELNTGRKPRMDESNSGEFLALVDHHLTIVMDTECVSGSFNLGGYWIHLDPDLGGICQTRHAEDGKKWPHHGNGRFLPPTSSKQTGKVLLASTNGFLLLYNPVDGTATMVNQRRYLEALDEAVGQPYLESQHQIEDRDRHQRLRAELGDTYDSEEPQPTRLKFTIAEAVLSDDGLKILTATNWDALRIWSVATGECEKIIPLPRAENWTAGHVRWLSLSSNGADCLLGMSDGKLYRLTNWKILDASWILVNSFGTQWALFQPLGGRSRVCVHSESVTGFFGGYGWSYSREYCNIYDLETGVSYPLTGPTSFAETGMPQAITPDQQHVVVHSVTEGRYNNIAAHYLRVLRLQDFQEVMRIPLRTGVKAVSNIAPDGRFAVLTESGDLLRLKLHLG